jgi:hypothetical protein
MNLMAVAYLQADCPQYQRGGSPYPENLNRRKSADISVIEASVVPY